MTVLCVPVLCCVRAVCLSSCENRPQHTAQEPQTQQKFESLKIINSGDDKIRLEFDELNTKRADIVRIYFGGHGIWGLGPLGLHCYLAGFDLLDLLSESPELCSFRIQLHVSLCTAG